MVNLSFDSRSQFNAQPNAEPNAQRESALVLEFADVGIQDVPLVGGKNASLGEMIQRLSSQDAFPGRLAGGDRDRLPETL